MKSRAHLVFVYELSQIEEACAYVTAHPGSQLFCLDFWVERVLKEQNVPFLSLRDYMPDSDTGEVWWVRAQDIAREWYRQSAMSFFEYGGIRIGEALEPMLEMYLSRLFYFVRIFSTLKKSFPEMQVFIPALRVGTQGSSGMGPLAYFERSAGMDAAYMVGALSGVRAVRTVSNKHLFPRTIWQSVLVGAYNRLIGLLPRHRYTIFASEYWSHIEGVFEHLEGADLVLMESSELKNISWKSIIAHRIRVKHPADVISNTERRRAIQHSKEFLEKWGEAQGAVREFLLRFSAEYDWTPVLEACEYLITYSSRVIADIDGLKNIFEKERPSVVLQRASIGGRQHHFFLMARVAAQLNIPSVELQHAGAVFDARSAHSRLEVDMLAAYGEVEREEYKRNGYDEKRIVSVGSPRLDSYAATLSVPADRAANLRVLGLNPLEPVVFVAVPSERAGLGAFDFSSYDLVQFFQNMRSVKTLLPAVQFIFKFRPRACAPVQERYLRRLFPEGSIAITDSNPQPLLLASDAVLSGNSTILYEAMLAKRPLVLYPWKKWDYYLVLYGAVAPAPQTREELGALLARVLSDEGYRRELLLTQQQFVSRHSFDGHAAERVAQLLTRMCGRIAP